MRRESPAPKTAQDGDDFLSCVLAGMRRQPKSIPPKFFYDARGSHLFDLICTTPEYYPTRTETAILERYGAQMTMRPLCADYTRLCAQDMQCDAAQRQVIFFPGFPPIRPISREAMKSSAITTGTTRVSGCNCASSGTAIRPDPKPLRARTK